MSYVIDTHGLRAGYGKEGAIADVSFAVSRGDFLGIVGPNGAGKTTLLKAILGLIPIASGDANLFGTPVSRFSSWERIGYMPQKSNAINPLFPASAEEVISLGTLAGMRFPKRLDAHSKERVRHVLERLRISHLRSRLLSELSGGEQQRVLLARAFVNDPELLIFDEPSVALDPDSRSAFFETLTELRNERGVTILLVTHDTGSIGSHANKMLYLDGRPVFFGSFEDFCADASMSSYFGSTEQHRICHQH